MIITVKFYAKSDLIKGHLENCFLDIVLGVRGLMGVKFHHHRLQ